MALVWRQSKLEARKAAWEDFLAVNRNALAMSDGKPKQYPDGAIYMDRKHPYSGDLAIFGHSSVFALINRSATPTANGLLAARIPDRKSAGYGKSVCVSVDLGWRRVYK